MWEQIRSNKRRSTILVFFMALLLMALGFTIGQALLHPGPYQVMYAESPTGQSPPPGQPPFTGANAQAVLARHVTDPVPPVVTVRAGVSRAVVAAIEKALAKAPADRFDSANAFAKALSSEEAEVADKLKSIVVLPFENLSPDPDNAFFADGLTEEIIADLSKVGAMRVISRTSAMAF